MLKNMDLCIFHAFLLYFAINSMAFENDIPLNDDEHKQMSEQGRSQYQLIKEKGTLPKYGACFKAALHHIDKGCRYLTEDTQSDIALHITNCFLQMSGHETYNCELDKKPNLRGICINSMSDRAFNVYTEFYTHTQNICWFLRGQIWHETISENTYRMGKQLAVSVEQQQDFNRLQKESIDLQVTMLEQGRFLERVLEDVSNSTKVHQQLLKFLSQKVSSLQGWIVGEISWIDSIIFSCFALVLIFTFTSCQRTINARFPLLFFLFVNILHERVICSFYTKYNEYSEAHTLYSNLYRFVWYSRYAFTFLSVITVLYIGFTYKDISQENLNLLNAIKKQNIDILENFKINRRSKSPNISSTATNYTEPKCFYEKEVNSTIDIKNELPNKKNRARSIDIPITANNEFHSNYPKKTFLSPTIRYELRSLSRQSSPDSGFDR